MNRQDPWKTDDLGDERGCAVQQVGRNRPRAAAKEHGVVQQLTPQASAHAPDQLGARRSARGKLNDVDAPRGGERRGEIADVASDAGVANLGCRRVVGDAERRLSDRAAPQNDGAAPRRSLQARASGRRAGGSSATSQAGEV